MVRLALQVQPNARCTEVVGVVAGMLKIRVAARSVNGEANAALLAWLSVALDVPKRGVHLIRGASSRHKLIELETPTMSADDVMQRLLQTTRPRHRAS